MRASSEGSCSSLQVTSAPSSSRPELGTTRHIHDYAVRPREACEYPAILNNIGRAVTLVYGSEKSLFDYGVISPSQTNLIQLEKHLLDLSSIAQATQGIFYVLAVGSGATQLVRFFESGSFIGFYHQKKGGASFPGCLTGHACRVYTEQDMTQRNCRKSAMLKNHPARGESNKVSKQRNRPGLAYSRELAHIKKQLEALKKIATDVEDKVPLSMFINVVRKNADLDNPDHCYVHTIGFAQQQQACLERALLDFRLEGCSQYPTLETLSNAPLPLPLQSQLDVLCSISNDPFAVYPTVDGTTSLASSRIGYMRYLSYQCPWNGDDSAPNMLPASLRNRYIYFHNNNRVAEGRKLLKHIFSGRNDTSDSAMVNSTDELLQSEQEVQDEIAPPAPPPSLPSKKKTRPVVQITSEILKRERVPCASSMSLVQVKPYQNFRTKLVEVGDLLWRLHTVDVEYFIMNEYVDGGELVPNSFVEVTYQKSDGHATCTCATYKIIYGIASTEKPGEDVLPAGILCMHCRFFSEEILPRLQLLDADETDDELPSLQQKLKESRVFLNNPVVPLTSGLGTRKYSVRPQTGSACATVHVSSTGIMANCTKGTCQAAQRHKRSVNGLLKLEDASSLCEHLATMHANREVWAPKQAPVETDEDEPEGDTLDVSTEEFAMPLEEGMIPPQHFFHPDTGKWDFGGYSTHKPLDEHDIQKSRNIQRRMAIYDGNPVYPRNKQTGCFGGMDLIPKIPDSNMCDCGSLFKNEQHPNGLPPVEDFACTLYMRLAPVQCKVYYLRCLNDGGSCKQLVKYSGQEDSVFLWSRQVGAGDEIGWDFINRVISSKMTFSAFCADMTRIYKSINILSAPFMHKSTFVSWFFAWCGRMDIDFRAEIDPWCGYNPKYVAGDGTHIGISFRRLSISPVEKADAGCTKTPRHKRFNRVFLPYRKGIDDSYVRKARKHLKDTGKAYLSRGTLDLATKEVDDQNLLEACPQDDRCKEFICTFLTGDMEVGLKQATAQFILLMASDAAVTTVLPPRCHQDVRTYATAIITHNEHSLSKFHLFCPELARVMEEAVNNYEYQQCFANFLLYLLDFVNSIHQHDEEHTPAVQIPSSYNPESGVAYYFTHHGNIVRQLPAYQVSSTGNHDDQPCLEERCAKKFGKVSFGGWTYLFLWFCPLHGHCYGYHIIQGAEGRKDPFASLVRYMEEPPKEVFYDFACSLSEYCLNREPGFFRDTRMWHDVFHSVTHVCGKNFKSRRLQFECFNTEICEQFNSFIQCIKYTGTHLSQSHFTFFTQFMIYVWNKRKTSTFNRKVDLALAGHE